MPEICLPPCGGFSGCLTGMRRRQRRQGRPGSISEERAWIYSCLQRSLRRERPSSPAPFGFVSSFAWNPFERPHPLQQAEPEDSDALFEFSFAYDYGRPQTFSAGFEYSVEAPGDASTKLAFELVNPSSKTFNLWNTTVRGSLRTGSAIIDARDYDLKMRLGLSLLDEPTAVVFAERGNYTVRGSGWTRIAQRASAVGFAPWTSECLVWSMASSAPTTWGLTSGRSWCTAPGWRWP